MNNFPVQRLPKAIAGLGIFVVAIGLAMALGGIVRADNPLPLLILGALSIAFGIWTLAFYKNWYIVVGPDFIQQRTAMGQVKTIQYTDIVWHNGNRFAQNTVIKAKDGTRIVFSTLSTEATSLHAYLRTFGHNQRY